MLGVRDYFVVEDDDGHRFWLFRRGDGQDAATGDLPGSCTDFSERRTWTEQPQLRPATPQEIEETLSFALRFKGRKRIDVAGPMIAQIAAEHLRRALEASGFVVMKRPIGQAPSTTRHHRREEDET